MQEKWETHIVFGATFAEHQERLRRVFTRLREENLKLKPSNCRFAEEEAHFLGHIVSQDGLATDEEKTTKIKEWPQPNDLGNLRSFLGLASY